MKVHELKIDSAQLKALVSGAKKAEIRINDRDYQVNDMLHLRPTRFTAEEMKSGKPLVYETGSKFFSISHIQTGYGLPEGMVVLSLEELIILNSKHGFLP